MLSNWPVASGCELDQSTRDEETLGEKPGLSHQRDRDPSDSRGTKACPAPDTE